MKLSALAGISWLTLYVNSESLLVSVTFSVWSLTVLRGSSSSTGGVTSTSLVDLLVGLSPTLMVTSAVLGTTFSLLWSAPYFLMSSASVTPSLILVTMVRVTVFPLYAFASARVNCTVLSFDSSVAPVASMDLLTITSSGLSSSLKVKLSALAGIFWLTV